MFPGLCTIVFALLVSFLGRSVEGASKVRRLTWSNNLSQPEFDHYECCQCNGVPDQCLGICFCDTNNEPGVVPIHDGHCELYKPDIVHCRNKCPSLGTTRRPPIPGPTPPKPPTPTPAPPVAQGFKDRCEAHGRKWCCVKPEGPRSCCKAKDSGTGIERQEDPGSKVVDIYTIYGDPEAVLSDATIGEPLYDDPTLPLYG